MSSVAQTKGHPSASSQTINLITPASNSVVNLTFVAAGTVSPPTSQVTGTATNAAGQQYQPTNIQVSQTGNFTMNFTVPAGVYTVQACISGTATCDQHNNITAR